MRFRTSVRMVMGLAAAGSAIVALSGTAAAADTLSANVAPQAPQQATTTLPVAPSVPNVSVPSVQDNSSSAKKTVVQSAGSTAGQSDSNNNDDTAAKQQPSAVSKDSTNGNSEAGGVSATVKQSGSSDQNNSGETPAVKSTTNLAASVPDSAKVEPALNENSPSLLALPPVVRFRSEMLPVQPTIVSFETAPADLASALPSAPQQRQQPHPAKSTGMLGSLTAVLAGTVVPQPLMLGGIGIVPLATALLLGLFTALLFTVFVFTYGSWLRRGGFATAARSDEPIFSNISSIATPLFLGYVIPLRRMHNPIFVVADTQILYKVLPPMFTERRIRI